MALKMDRKMRGLANTAISGAQKTIDTVGSVIPGSTGVAKAFKKATTRKPRIVGPASKPPPPAPMPKGAVRAEDGSVIKNPKKYYGK